MRREGHTLFDHALGLLLNFLLLSQQILEMLEDAQLALLLQPLQ